MGGCRVAEASRRTVFGVDGCAHGWVVVRLVDGAVAEVEVVDHVAELLAEEIAAVGVDMPIGLVDSARRDADVAARKLLPGRASTVFSAPPRAVVDAHLSGEVHDHAGASALARRVTGKGVSQQAWRLVLRIAEVDRLAAAGAPVREVHPEVAFALLVGDALPRKRTWAGVQTRRALLARIGLELPDRFGGDERAAPDDVLDAAIVAWVADGIATGQGVLPVPDRTGQRDHGRPILIHGRVPGSGGPAPR